MVKVEILGANRFETYTKTRGASRAVIVRDGMILLTFNHTTEQEGLQQIIIVDMHGQKHIIVIMGQILQCLLYIMQQTARPT